MKPKTKLQMEIVNGSRKLAPVSEAQKRYAYKHCFVHYFKRDAKGNCFCLDCGHTWRDKEDKKNCKCFSYLPYPAMYAHNPNKSNSPLHHA